jgi:hypothetical protein
MNIMNHQDALQIHAAERYLLNELTADERNDFEEHYFGCPECADDVKAVFTFADNAKAVFADQAGRQVEPQRKQSLGWWASFNMAWAASAAAALLLGVTVYQSLLVVPRLERELAEANAPRVVPSVVARAATRGDEAAVQIGKDERFVHLVFDVNSAKPGASYACEVRDGSGRIIFALPVSISAPGTSLSLLLPTAQLPPGPYTVSIRPQAANPNAPGAGPEVERYSFVLERK